MLVSSSALSLRVHNAEAARLSPTPLGERPGRQQFGVVAAGSLIVWEDRLSLPTTAPVVGGAADPTAGSANIYGMDLASNRSIVVANGPGDQAEPAISGTLVAWQDSGHSCPTCELDVHALDVATGERFAIATGPADQAHAAVAGRTVVWIEADTQGTRLLGTQLDTGEVFEITTISSDQSFGRPVMSERFVVWGQYGSEAPYTLHAYNLDTRQLSQLAVFDTLRTEYAINGASVLWTDPRPHLVNLETGESTILTDRAVSGPSIVGDRVIWSERTIGTATDYDIYAVDLESRAVTPLVVTDGNQRRPIIAAGTVLWQHEAATGARLMRALLDDALAAGIDDLSSQQLAFNQGNQGPADRAVGSGLFANGNLVVAPVSHDTSYTRPTYKGMHVSIGDGWTVSPTAACTSTSCPAIDALKNGNAPLFGSLLVIDQDLSRDTGRDTPLTGTNRAVADWMKYWQSSYSVRPIVRLWPNTEPNSAGTKTPDTVAQKVISLATNYDWVKHVQIDNEPNLAEGWADSCKDGQAACTWTSSGSTRSFRWNSVYDYRKYQAINQFYADAWYAVNYYKTNHPDATVRSRLTAMELWTPPMSDIFRTLDNGANFYDYLQGMLDLYDRMTYHTYPAPNYDADGAGGIINNSWSWFNSWVQTRVNGGTLRSIITEFGWNPDQMARQDCITAGTFPSGGLTQNHSWPATGTSGCKAEDGYVHTFENDIARFLANQRHNAEVVAVWIVNGWSTRADGLDANDVAKRWFHNYQWSNP